MTLAFIYSSDYSLVQSKGLTISEAIKQGYIVWASIKDTHMEIHQELKVRCLN